MRNTLERIKRHSKKGTTLVELVVAMTLTLIFAVVCVALINPIERTYQNVEKMSRAQLLADTIIDSIRKECDDVQYDDPNAVWLVAAGNSADDDQMLFAVPSGSKPASGNVLIIKKDNKYCEAIYSCFPISSQNISNLTANPADGSTSAHAASTLTGDNLNRGLVHFGYYQGKYSKDGLYPFKAYDYTNPVTASTYGDYTVALLFERVGCKTINGVEYPAFVECTVKVYKGDYNNGGEFIYSRTAAVCFSANGSAQGSAGNIDTSSTTHVRDYNVVIEWDDGNAADRPASVVVKLCDDLNDLDPSNDVVLRTHTLDTTKTRFVFADVKTTGKAYIIVPDFPGYTTMGPISRSDGFYVKYQRSDSAKLIRGIELRNKMSKQVTNVIFGLKSDPVLAEAVKNASRSEMVARNADDTLSDKYMLYIVDGTDEEGNPKKTAYILSDDPKIVLNEDSSQMFWDCTQLKQITGLEMLDTSNVIDMHRMFKNCKKLSQDFIFTNWDTSNVQAFDSMFYNVGTDVPDDTRMTIDVRCFDFRSACDYGTGSDGMPIVGINKMFFADVGSTSHIETIIFPTDSEMKEMVNVPRIQQVFNGCDHLVNLENFNYIDFSGLVPVEDPYKTIEYIFGECVSLKELNLSNWNCPNVETIDFLTTGNKIDGLKNLEKLDMSGLNLSGCSSVDNMLSGAKSLKEIDLSDSNLSGVTELGIFKGKTTLTKVDLSGCTSGITSVAGMFYNCSNLETVDLTGVINSNITSIASVFEGCNKLKNICLDGCVTSNVTDMSYAFKNCHTNTADNFEISLAGIEFSNVVNMTEMFNGTGASVISFPNGANFSKVENIDGLFRNCKGLTTINGFQNVEFPLVTDASHLFGGCSSLTSVDFDMEFNSAKYIDYMFSNCTSLGSVNLTMDYPEAISAKGLFYGCSGLSNATLVMNLKDVTDITSMFYGCESLSNIDLDLYAPGVTSIEGLFSGCKNLTTLDFDAELGSVENVSYLFNDCAKLETANLDLDFQSVIHADYLFNGCSSLKSIESFNLNMPNVVSLDNVFTGCSSLTSITLDWNLQNATTIKNLFQNCTALETVDIRLNLPKVTSVNNMFSGCSSLTNVTAELKLPLVTNLNKLFNGCSNLTEVDLSDSDFSGLTSSKEMFNNCAKLTHITMDRVNLSKCTTTSSTFNNCNAITHISMKNANLSSTKDITFVAKNTIVDVNLSGADLSGVTTLKETFKGKTALTTVDLSDITISNCYDLTSMFDGCKKLQTVNMKNFKTTYNGENYVKLKSMFQNCSSLTSFSFEGWDFTNVGDISYMFRYCTSLKSFTWEFKLTDRFLYATGVFTGCTSLESVDISNSDFGACTKISETFQNCTNLKTVNMNGVKLENCTDFTNLFTNCKSLSVIQMNKAHLNQITSLAFISLKYTSYSIELDEAQLPGITNLSSAFVSNTLLTSVSFKSTELYNCTTYSYMFSGCTNLTSAAMSPKSSDAVTGISCESMFLNCKALNELDLSGWDTSNVTNMKSMFQSCYSLPGIDFTKWQGTWSTANVTNMSYMFFDCCYGTTTYDPQFVMNLGNFNFASATDLSYMFGCTDEYKDNVEDIIFPVGTTGDSEPSVYEGNPKALNVKKTIYMFTRRTNLVSITNLGWFELGENLTEAKSMFSRSGCYELDIRRIRFVNLLGNDNGSAWIFGTCRRLTTIYVAPGTDYSNMWKGKETFNDCEHLVGGGGTTYTKANNGKAYARIDDPSNNQKGYFTSKGLDEA